VQESLLPCNFRKAEKQINMRKKIFPFLLIAFLGCNREHELKKSIFFQDPNFPGLPEYSEWGYNTFGVYYDRNPFTSNSEVEPLKVIYNNNKTSFVFTGNAAPGAVYYGYPFTMTFTIMGYKPKNYGDLATLNDTTFALTDAIHEIIISDGHQLTDTLEVLEGEFQIKRAQYLLVDKKPTEVILSGVFGFKAISKGGPVTFSEGRFDLGIGPDNFYAY
jgi:hypothetical protein